MRKLSLVSLVLFASVLAFGAAAFAEDMGQGAAADPQTGMMSAASTGSRPGWMYDIEAHKDWYAVEKDAQGLVGQTREQLTREMGRSYDVHPDGMGGKVVAYEIHLANTSFGAVHWVDEYYDVAANATVASVKTIANY